MKQKHLEMRKTQAMERIEAKLDLLAKALKVDFSVLDAAPEAVAPVEKQESDDAAPEAVAPVEKQESDDAAPEAVAPEETPKPRKNK